MGDDCRPNGRQLTSVPGATVVMVVDTELGFESARTTALMNGRVIEITSGTNGAPLVGANVASEEVKEIEALAPTMPAVAAVGVAVMDNVDRSM